MGCTALVKVYAAVLIDAISFKVRDGRVTNPTLRGVRKVLEPDYSPTWMATGLRRRAAG